MNYNLFTENLANPALHFFVISVFNVYLKSNLEIHYNL